MSTQYDVVIVGAGFTGLVAGLDLARAGRKVLILERDAGPGGLAGTFEFKNGITIEKFYHHWFNNDEYVPELASELGIADQIVTLPSKTGMYFNGKHWRLSTPLDLLRFSPLPLLDRIRLGLLVFQVRKIKDWKTIEHLSIREWLEPLCGKNVFKVVWQPLIESKFSVYADAVNAVWFWKNSFYEAARATNRAANSSLISEADSGDWLRRSQMKSFSWVAKFGMEPKLLGPRRLTGMSLPFRHRKAL